MAADLHRDPDLEWLDHVQPVGLVVAPSLLKELGLGPERQGVADSDAVDALFPQDDSKPALDDPWEFVRAVLKWDAKHVAGAPGGPPLPESLTISLPEHDTQLSPTWAVAEPDDGERPWQLLVRVEAAGIDPDRHGALDGWEAKPQQRFERLLRDTGVYAGILISEPSKEIDGDTRYEPQLRLVYAPRGETSGHLTFPLRPLATAAGRPMLGGLKLLLGYFRLFNAAPDRRLPALLRRSRDAQASVSTELAGQVLGALHELLRALNGAEPRLMRELARTRPDHLYEGLLSVLMRLVFILYAEDRDLLPSSADPRARQIYQTSYSVRGLYARLVQDAALYPDTMNERRGAWGQLLALFGMIHGGHDHFVQARGGKLFDPEEHPFLLGRTAMGEPNRVMSVSDGAILRILDGLMTLKRRGQERERLSYRALDVEQIGSVYETVMGFTVQTAQGRVLAIKAGKNNRTPVFVELEKLLAASGKDRIKFLKEEVDRALPVAHAKAVEAAKSVDQLVAALDSVVDERASPGRAVAPADTPILQPTDERRRSGSHYTPRSLTAPIVKYALEPAFECLGIDATPEQVLDLKVCDPAMGSGAFLVEACRAIGERLVLAWEKHKDRKPAIPADEDEQLHARRLVAQRCLYGVDKNPRAVDLARLSLWLATLAKDHEFSFLDHALKSGDSLVGLTRAQIERATWGDADAPSTLFSAIVRDRVQEALKGRAEIRAAPDNVSRAIQEHRYAQIERGLQRARDIGDAMIAAFFSADKAKARETKRAEVESWLQGTDPHAWEKVAAFARTLQTSEPRQPVWPFHWELEFPEVFARDNPGFDAIVGNPPFAGKNTIIASNHKSFPVWLQELHFGAHGNADLVAHFFRRAFSLLREDGVLGLIATNTIGQGDTRDTGLSTILETGGSIARATRRLKWPGEAAVVVSVIHVAKGATCRPILNDEAVQRISAYLVEGQLDHSPPRLEACVHKSFQGSIILGMGFTFDDAAAAKGDAESPATMRELIEKNKENADRIFPYIGGDEVNTDPQHAHRRFAIDFFDRPLGRRSEVGKWLLMTPDRRAACLAQGLVPQDYPGEVAEDWPDLIEIVRRRVKPERDRQTRKALKDRWWQYAEKRPGLYRAIEKLSAVLVTCRHSPNWAVALLPSHSIYAESLLVFAISGHASFAVLQSRVHEVWARFFGSSIKDDLRYTPSVCFETFPLQENYTGSQALEDTGHVYHDHRAALMIARNEGMTKTYNRFHDRTEKSEDIRRLRELHADMDRAVLEAYGWHDLAERAQAVFLDETNEDDHTYQGRLFWPSEFRDEVLARLLALNAERHAEEVRQGTAPGMKGMPRPGGVEEELDAHDT